MSKTKLYYLKIKKNHKNFYKIGITNKGVTNRFGKKDLLEMEELEIWEYNTRDEALYHEKRILKKYDKYRNKDSLLHKKGGDTEIFTKDVLGLDTNNQGRFLSFFVRITSKMKNPLVVFRDMGLLFVFFSLSIYLGMKEFDNLSTLLSIIIALVLGLLFSFLVTPVKLKKGIKRNVLHILFDDKVTKTDITLQESKCRMMLYEHKQKRKKFEDKIKKLDENFSKKYILELEKLEELKFYKGEK